MTEQKIFSFKYSNVPNVAMSAPVVLAGTGVTFGAIWVFTKFSWIPQSTVLTILQALVALSAGIVFVLLCAHLMKGWGTREGEAIFEEQEVRLRYGSKDITIPYNSISSLALAIINNPRRQGGGYRLLVDRVRIDTQDRRIRINIAHIESGELLEKYDGIIGKRYFGAKIVRNLDDVESYRDILNEISLVGMLSEIGVRSGVQVAIESNFRSRFMQTIA